MVRGTGAGEIVRGVAYYRVSREEQAKKQNPIATQQTVCAEVFERRGGIAVNLEAFSDEGFSGTLGPREEGDGGKHRIGYTHMLQRVEEGDIDIVVVQSLDRLGRDERDMAELRESLAERGVQVLTPGRLYDLADADDAMMFGIHAVIGAHQPRQTSAKSRAGKKQRARRGLPKSGSAPFGWRMEEPGEYTDPRQRSMLPVPEEGEVVLEMVELYLRGWGYPRIAKHLLQKNTASPGTRGWYSNMVRQALMNPVHAGLIHVEGDEYAQGKHYEHRYYDPDKFHAIRREMERRGSVVSYAPVSQSFLVGTLRCGDCGEPMSSRSSGYARYYRCRGSNFDPLAECSNVSRRADHVEQVVINAVGNFATSEEVRRPAAERIASLLSVDDSSARERAKYLEQRLTAAYGEIEWLIDEAAKRPEIRRSFDERLRVRQERVTRLRAELADLQDRQADVEQRTRQLEAIRQILLDFDAIWSGLDTSERRRIIAILFEEMSLNPTEGGSLLRMKPFFGAATEVFIPALSRTDRPRDGLQALTKRECEVLHLLDGGLAPQEIADALGCSKDMVWRHAASVREKLHVRTNEEAIEASRQAVAERLPFLNFEGPAAHRVAPLSEKEREILPDLADPDLLYREIGAKHNMKEGTVKAHVAHMAEKLRVSGGRRLVVNQARRLGLLPPD